MKKFLSTFFSLFLFFVAGAQIKFCEKGSRWYSEFNSGGFPLSSSFYYTVSTEYDGKDTLQNDSVKVLLSSRFFISGSSFGNVKLYLKQIGDTIFMNSAYSNHQWQILFNFAATTGDKWYNILQASEAISYTTTVVSTQTVLINGFTLKQLSILQTNDSWYEKQINYLLTERIGSDKFVFSFAGAQHPDGDYFARNLCYSDDAFGTYYYGGNSCISTTDIVKNMAFINGFNMYPNPTNAHLYISFENITAINSHYTFAILNVLGEKIKEGDLNFFENETSINTSDLENGIYFIRIDSFENDNPVISRRFVKTDSRARD